MPDLDTSEDTTLRFSRRDKEQWDKLLRDLRSLQKQVNDLQAVVADHEARIAALEGP